MKYTRIIEGSFIDYPPSEYYRRCFLCCRMTSNYYYSTQRTDLVNIYKIFLCQPCQAFKHRLSPTQYSQSIQNYINATWGDNQS